MEEYILITWLNDFIFCPASIYYHNLYGNTVPDYYNQKYEKAGRNAHESIDNKTYSKAKNIFQSEYVVSEKYKLIGKIDVYNAKTKELIERKRKVKTIYDRYIFQIYAQYECLKEMGFEINKIKIYSMEDNKTYNIKLPEDDEEMFKKFKKLLKRIRSFNLEKYKPDNKDKCNRCSYKNICDRGLNDFEE